MMDFSEKPHTITRWGDVALEGVILTVICFLCLLGIFKALEWAFLPETLCL